MSTPRNVSSPIPEISTSDAESSDSDDGEPRQLPAESDSDEPENDIPDPPRYPQRVRRPRVVEGAVSWNDVTLG